MKIAIIGFGRFGKALANILEAKKETHEICVWDIAETGDRRQVKKCEEALLGAEIVLIAVPSTFFGESLKNLSCVPKNAMIASCTKGFDGKTNKLPIEILKQAFPKNPLGVLSGPMLSEELGEGLPTKATFASTSKKDAEKVIRMFKGTNLALEYSKDIKSVSLLGILKNVYALGTGLSDGLSLGSNFRSCVALRAVKEMKEILSETGGKKESFMTYAGLSDFLTTAYSPKSRNYQYGHAWGEGKKAGDNLAEEICPELVEGVDNIARIKKYTRRASEKPLFRAIENIFMKNKEPKKELLKAV